MPRRPPLAVPSLLDEASLVHEESDARSELADSDARELAPNESDVRELAPDESDVRELAPDESDVRELAPDESDVRELAPRGSDARIERVVRQLNAICKAATFDFALAVGKLVVDSFYSGDLSKWRSRDQRKDVSLRKLIAHQDLPMSGSALYRSLAIYEISERLQLRSWDHVSTSHIRLVLPLPAEEQARLLRLSEQNRWSVRRLDEEIAEIRRDDPAARASRGGRRRASRLGAAVRSFERSIIELQKAIGRGAPGGADEDPSAESTRGAILLLRNAAHTCSILETRLAQSLTEASDAHLGAWGSEGVVGPADGRSPQARDSESNTWPIDRKRDGADDSPSARTPRHGGLNRLADEGD